MTDPLNLHTESGYSIITMKIGPSKRGKRGRRKAERVNSPFWRGHDRDREKGRALDKGFVPGGKMLLSILHFCFAMHTLVYCVYTFLFEGVKYCSNCNLLFFEASRWLPAPVYTHTLQDIRRQQQHTTHVCVCIRIITQQHQASHSLFFGLALLD